MMSAHRVEIIELTNLNQIKAVAGLIARGCNVNEQDDLGRCAILYAVINNNPPMVELLIKAGAKVELEDDFGRSPLSEAKKRKFDRIIGLLEVVIKTGNQSPNHIRGR